jgi:TusA-related sulfurtransferase
MMDAVTSADEVGAPTDGPVETLDARELPPPQPLQSTLERLADLEDDVVLVQRNDRAPQHLYPQLDDRGYAYETISSDDHVVTVIWRAAE